MPQWGSENKPHCVEQTPEGFASEQGGNMGRNVELIGSGALLHGGCLRVLLLGQHALQVEAEGLLAKVGRHARAAAAPRMQPPAC